MSNFKAIRNKLGVSQVDMAAALGCTQGNIAHYEKGQTVPPDAAARLIRYARKLGVVLTFDEIYAEVKAKRAKQQPKL